MTEKGIVQTPQNFDPSDPSNSVSVVIPLYNGANFIRETLECVLRQTVPAAEIFVVNDGSTDGGAAVVESFGSAVTLINIENSGAQIARNTAVARATGNWLAFCDSDDLWLPTKLEKQLRVASTDPEIHCVLTDFADLTDGVVADRSHFSYAPKDFWPVENHDIPFVVRQPIAGKLSLFQPGITSTPLVKREFYLRVGGFDPNAPNSAEDTCFHFRNLSVVPFGVVPEVLMHYRRHPASWSADRLKQMRNTVITWHYIVDNYPQARPYRQELLRGLADMHKDIAATQRHQTRQKLKRLLGWRS